MNMGQQKLQNLQKIDKKKYSYQDTSPLFTPLNTPQQKGDQSFSEEVPSFPHRGSNPQANWSDLLMKS